MASERSPAAALPVGAAVVGSALERPVYSILGIGYRLIVSGEHTGGAYELMQFVVPGSHGPPAHVHHREDECFYVVDGEFLVTVGEQQIRAAGGSVIHLPRNVPHQFRNVGAAPSTFLCWVLPGQLASFFAAFQRDWPIEKEQPHPVNDEDLGRLMKAAAEHDIEMLLYPTSAAA